MTISQRLTIASNQPDRARDTYSTPIEHLPTGTGILTGLLYNSQGKGYLQDSYITHRARDTYRTPIEHLTTRARDT